MTETKAASVTVPAHLGIIMDGNRRWAKQHGQPTLNGHRQGLEALKDVALAAFERGVKVVSAFVFSTENWQRTQEEVSFLMSLVSKGIDKHLATFDEAGIKLVMLGERRGIDKAILGTIDKAVAQTASNQIGTLALCFNYGGQDEIVQAAQAAANSGSPITIENLASHLYQPQLPPIDFLIRTSGERRLSGFMLWRAAYSELYFSDVLWPDFSANDLDIALQAYAQRQRRFGA
ncbi:MAG: polyprenyl diphosphate synthase [Candidatus Saccharimonadales bacterium]